MTLVLNGVWALFTGNPLGILDPPPWQFGKFWEAAGPWPRRLREDAQLEGANSLFAALAPGLAPNAQVGWGVNGVVEMPASTGHTKSPCVFARKSGKAGDDSVGKTVGFGAANP